MSCHKARELKISLNFDIFLHQFDPAVWQLMHWLEKINEGTCQIQQKKHVCLNSSFLSELCTCDTYITYTQVCKKCKHAFVCTQSSWPDQEASIKKNYTDVWSDFIKWVRQDIFQHPLKYIKRFILADNFHLSRF